MTASFSDIRKYFKELVSLATGAGEKRSYHKFFSHLLIFFNVVKQMAWIMQVLQVLIY